MNMKLGWLRDLPDHRDYTQDHPAISPVLATASNSKRPPTKDLREFCSPIEDQRTIGSCTAQAGVGLMEWFQRRAYGKHLNMSRMFLYKVSRRLAGLKGDSGSYLRSTMQAMVLVGVPPESMWPYNVNNFDAEPDSYTYALARRFGAFSYYRLAAAPGKPLLETLLSSLAGGLPFMFGFSVFSNISDDGWIPVPAPGVTFEGGHAVVAVGYDDAKQALLIRNSWGTGWGHRGYGWLPYHYITEGLADDFWSLVKADFVDTDIFKV